jgi:hypothetical protein
VLVEFWACANTAPPVAIAVIAAIAITRVLMRLVMSLLRSLDAKRSRRWRRQM